MTIADGCTLAESLYPDQAVDQREYLRRFGYDPPPLVDVVSDAAPLPAEIRQGLWVVLCACGAGGLPVPGCVVWRDDPLMWCPRCDNGGRGWWRVCLPAECAEIERLLMLRPELENRNWQPGESVDDLRAETLAHGVGAED